MSTRRRTLSAFSKWPTVRSIDFVAAMRSTVKSDRLFGLRTTRWDSRTVGLARALSMPGAR